MGYNPSVSTCGPMFNPQHCHLFWGVFNAGVVTFITLLSTAFVACNSYLKRVHDNVGYYTFIAYVSYVGTHSLSCDLRAFIFNMDLLSILLMQDPCMPNTFNLPWLLLNLALDLQAQEGTMCGRQSLELTVHSVAQWLQDKQKLIITE